MGLLSASGVRLGPESGGGEEWDSRLPSLPAAAPRLGAASDLLEDFTRTERGEGILERSEQPSLGF